MVTLEDFLIETAMKPFVVTKSKLALHLYIPTLYV